MDMGSSVCCAQEQGEADTAETARVLTQKNWKLAHHPVTPRNWTLCFWIYSSTTTNDVTFILKKKKKKKKKKDAWWWWQWWWSWYHTTCTDENNNMKSNNNVHNSHKITLDCPVKWNLFWDIHVKGTGKLLPVKQH